MMKIQNRPMFYLGLAWGLADLLRVYLLPHVLPVAGDHTFHLPPLIFSGALMAAGMYPERIVALAERVAPGAVAKWTGKLTGEHQKPPAGKEGE